MRKQITHIECPEEWESTNDYDSHRPLLYMAINLVPGSVYEFGCGYGSTDLIQKYCTARTRISVETNKQWAAKFQNVVLVDSYFDILYPLERLGVIFIDCAPGEIRRELIEHWADYANVLVIHDSEPTAEYVYGLTPVLSNFKYRVDYRPEGKPHTTAVSNFVNIEEWVKNES